MADDNKLMLEFGAKLDSSINNAFKQLTSVVAGLDSRISALANTIDNMASTNSTAARSVRELRAGLSTATETYVRHNTAVAHGHKVSEAYLRTQKEIANTYGIETAQAGHAARALERTEKQYRRNLQAIDNQRRALKQLLETQKSLAIEYSYASTVKEKFMYYDMLQNNARDIRNANVNLTRVGNVAQSFDYAATYAKNLRAVMDATNGVTLATRMFGKEQKWVQDLANTISARTRDNAIEQKRQLNQLRQYVKEVGSEYQRLDQRIRISSAAMASASMEERAAIRKVIDELQRKQMTLVTSAATGGVSMFDRWATGITKVEQQYQRLRTTFSQIDDVARRVLANAQKGIISYREAQQKLTALATTNAAATTVTMRTGMTNEQMNMLLANSRILADVDARRLRTQHEITDALARQARQAGANQTIFQRMATELANTVKLLAQYAVAGSAVYGVASAFRSGAATIVEYDQALKDLQAITLASNTDVAALGEEIKRVAVETRYGITEVANGAKVIGQAGYDASQTMQVLGATMQLAQGTMSDVTSTADLLTTALMSFRMNASDAAQMADVMAMAVNRSKLDIEKLRTVFNYIGPVAMDAGLSIKEAAAATMLLANNGMKASTIGTSLRNVFSQLESPSAKLRKIFAESGEDISKLADNSLTLVDKFKLLNKVLGTNNDLYKLFGLRAAGAVSILRTFPEELQKMQDSLYVMGTASVMADTQMQGLANRLENLKAAAGVFAVSTTKTITSMFSELVLWTQKAISALTEFSSGALGEAITTIAGLSAAILAVVAVVKTFGAALAFLGGSTMLGSVSAALTAANTSLLAWSTGCVGATAATTTLTAGVGGLSAALTTLSLHPMLAIFTAITVAVGAMWLGLKMTEKQTYSADIAANKYTRDLEKQRDVLKRGMEANKNIANESLRIQNALSVAKAVPGIADALLPNIKDRAKVESIMQEYYDSITNAEVTHIRKYSETIVARIKEAEKRRDDAIAAASKMSGGVKGDSIRVANTDLWGNTYGEFSVDELSRVVTRENAAITADEEKLKRNFEALVAEAKAATNNINEFLQYLDERMGSSFGKYGEELREAAKRSYELQTNTVDLAKSASSLDEVMRSYDLKTIKETAGAYGDLATAIEKRLTPAAIALDKAIAEVNKKTALTEEQRAAAIEDLKRKYGETVAKVIKNVQDEDMRAAKLAYEYRRREIEQTIIDGTVASEEGQKQIAALDAEFAKQQADRHRKLLVDWLTYTAQINNTKLEPKTIELLFKGDFSGVNFLSEADKAILGSMLTQWSQLANAANSKALALKGGNGGGGGRRENRDKLAALKAQLAAEQALNEQAYQLGKITYDQYTEARIASEKRLLDARQAQINKMKGAERERAQQELNKDKAEFEVKLLKETQDAAVAASDRKIAASTAAYDHELALMERNGATQDSIKLREEQNALRIAQLELDALKERESWQMNSVKREELATQILEQKTAVLKAQREVENSIYDVLSKNAETELRLGQLTVDRYNKIIDLGVKLGRIDPYEGMKKQMAVSDNPLDGLRLGVLNVKEDIKSLNETLSSVTETMVDGLMDASDEFVESWHKGAKSVQEIFNDMVQNILMDVQKLLMRNFIQSALFGGTGDNNTYGINGGLFGLLLGGVGLNKQGQQGDDTAKAVQDSANALAGAASTMSVNSTNSTNAALAASNAMQGSAGNINNTASGIFGIIGSLASSLLQAVFKIGEGIFSIFTSIFSGGGGGGLGGLFGSIVGGIIGGFAGGGGGYESSVVANSSAAVTAGANSLGNVSYLTLPAAKGAIFQGGSIGDYSNQIVTKPTNFLYDHVAKFAKGGIFSGKRGLMGEAGAEAVLPLTRTNGGLGVSAEGIAGSTTNVVINAPAGYTGEETSRRRNDSGGEDVTITIKKMIAEDAAKEGGLTFGAMSRTFGARRVLTPRG